MILSGADTFMRRLSWFLEVRQISQGERPGCCRLGAEKSREGGKSYSESQHGRIALPCAVFGIH